MTSDSLPNGVRIDYKIRDKGMGGMHHHNWYEIVFFCKAGESLVQTEKTFELKDGTILFFLPNERHRTIGNKIYERYCLYFTETFLNTYFTAEAKQKLIECFQYHSINLSRENFDIMRTLFDSTKKLYEDDNIEYIFSAISFILTTIQKSTVNADVRERRCNKATKRIKDYITERLSGSGASVNVSDIAEALFFSESYMCRAFKKETGYTVSQYINRMKIQKACIYFKYGIYSLTEIAEKSGFASLNYFSRCFKDVMGITPTEFKQQYNQE